MTRPILYISGPYSAGNGRTVADNIAVAGGMRSRRRRPGGCRLPRTSIQRGSRSTARDIARGVARRRTLRSSGSCPGARSGAAAAGMGAEQGRAAGARLGDQSRAGGLRPARDTGGDPARRGVQEAVPVTFRPAGEARLDLYTDALILDIGPGYVRGAARPARRPYVAPTTRGRSLPAVLGGNAPGVFEDVEQGLRLRRSQTDRSLMLIEQGASTRSQSTWY